MQREKARGLTDMTVGSPMRHILKFSIPLLIGNLFQQLYNMADSIIVGNFMGEESKAAQAAVNTSMPVIFLMVALFAGLGMGATVVLSQNYGAKKMDAVRKTIRTIYTVLMAAAIPLTLIGILIAPPLMRLLGVPDTSFKMATTYVTVIFIGTIGSLGYNINAGILQGLGDSRTPLRFLIISTLLNIVLDLLLVAVIPLGVLGVAIATITAQLFSWLYGIWYIRKKYPELELNMFKFGIDKHLLQQILRLGLPAAVQQSLFSFGMLFMQNLINSGGDAFMSGFGNANRIDAFVFLPVFSFSAALTTFTGQNMGVRQIDRVKKGLRATLFLSLTAFVVLTSLSVFFGRSLLWLFNRDPEVINNGMHYIYQILPFSFIINIQFMLVSVMRGSGQAMVPVLTTILGFIAVRIPSAYLLAHFFGLNYMFFSYPIGWVISLTTASIVFATGRWQHKLLIMPGLAEASSGQQEHQPEEIGS